MRKEAALEFLPKGEAAESAVCGDDAVAGNEQANGVGGHGLANGPRGARLAFLGGQLAVRARLAKRNTPQSEPDAFLERGARLEL